MEKKMRISAVVAEKSAGVADAATACFKHRSYEVETATTREGLLALLKKSLVHIAIVGDVEGSGSPFETLREAVMTSPLTSVVLMTDAPAHEVEEKAEGYGILGHVGRDVPADAMGALLDSFEKIRQALL